MRALYVAASGMNAQQTRIDTVADNLANSATTGFKRARGAFQDVFYQEMTSGQKTEAQIRADVGGGVRLAGLEKDHRGGALVDTGDPYNIALQGAGFLVVEDGFGNQAYTRDGALSRDSDGVLMTASGLRVAGDITVPMDAGEIIIERDGTVSAVFGTDVEPTVLGQLEVAEFTNPAGLRSLGGNLYQATPDSGEPMPTEIGDRTEIVQRFLENSNVDVAEELIELIMAQRAYELNSKVIQAADDTMQMAASLKR